MIKTIYTCDKCRSEQATKDQFWTIGVWATPHGSLSESAAEHKLSIQVCRPCLEGLGVHVMRETMQKREYVERTTEDILRELIERVKP